MMSNTTRLAVAVLATVMMAGCSTHLEQPPNTGDSRLFQSASTPPPLTPYLLQPGDLLAIRFYRNPELDQDVTVRPDGMISLPFVDEVEAAGKSPKELDQELTRRFTGELATPDVAVIVQQFAGHKVYVGGEVGTQGVVPMTSPLTLYQAIQEAGGFLDTAHPETVVVVRRDGAGKVVSRLVNLEQVQNGSDLAQDIYLAPYDVVWVPKSGIANADLFVDQYIRQLLPINPGVAVRP